MKTMVRSLGGFREIVQNPFMNLKNLTWCQQIRVVPQNVPGVSYRRGWNYWIEHLVMVEWLPERKENSSLDGSRRYVLFMDNYGGSDVKEEERKLWRREKPRFGSFLLIYHILYSLRIHFLQKLSKKQRFHCGSNTKFNFSSLSSIVTRTPLLLGSFQTRGNKIYAYWLMIQNGMLLERVIRIQLCVLGNR